MFSTFIFAALLLALTPAETQAGQITGECKSLYLKWQKHGGYGAFAWSPRNRRCGYNNDYDDLADAKSGALGACAKSDCSIYDTLNSLSESGAMHKA